MLLLLLLLLLFMTLSLSPPSSLLLYPVIPVLPAIPYISLAFPRVQEERLSRFGQSELLTFRRASAPVLYPRCPLRLVNVL